jgi:hypothetical protein
VASLFSYTPPNTYKINHGSLQFSIALSPFGYQKCQFSTIALDEGFYPM